MFALKSNLTKTFGKARLLTAGTLAAAAMLPQMANALQVIPGAYGFGTSTPAGRGGAVYRVTNLNADGTGSLKACVDKTGARVCVFEISGTIKLASDLVVRNPNLTIAGQTAPSPGIMLRGAALRIQTSDVLVQHIRVRVGDDATGPSYDNRDALKIETTSDKPIRNIVIDHCSFSWSIDEMATAWLYWDNVSFLNNIFAEPLNESFHPKGAHGYGILFGPHNGKASMVGNLMAHQVERNALSYGGQFVYVNNVVYNRSNMDVDLQSQNGIATLNSVVGNVFIRGADYTRTNRPVLLHTSGSLVLPLGSRLYVSDNAALEATSDAWSVVSPITSLLSFLKVSSTPTWPSGLVARKTANNAVRDAVLTNAGARPADRDSVDKRVVQSVRDGTGRIINCVSPNGTTRCQKNAGGWPVMAVRTRTLTLPSNPNGVTSSGYTNLEVWLQAMSANVEGRTVTTAPASPTTVQVR